MEETKKRWRPSLRAYRALEAALDMLQKQYDDLAEKERIEAKDYGRLEKEYNDLLETCKEQRSKILTLEHSNYSLQTGLSDERKRSEAVTADYHKARREVIALRERTLWQRIINK